MVEKFRGVILRIPCTDRGSIKSDNWWYTIEEEIANQYDIDISDYEFLQYTPGMTARGLNSNHSLSGHVDGYELYLKKK